MRLLVVTITALFATSPLFAAQNEIVAEDAASDGAIRGIVRAEAEAKIASELVAVVESLPFKAGQAFNAGDVIVQFDCRRYEADLRAAEAEVESAKITVDTNQKLITRRAVGADELAISKAKLNQAEAAAEGMKVRTDQCTIKAPFNGRVVERFIQEHEMPEANAPLLSIVKEGNLQLDLIVPSNWLLWLQPGQKFRFKVDVTNTEHDAEVMYVGAVVDPISRTATISAELLNPSSTVRPGMSGSAIFDVPNG